MKKILFIALALMLAFGQVVSFADVQINEGQEKTTAPVKFFIGRVAGATYVSADRVVIWDTTSKDGVTVTMTTTSADKLVAGIAMDNIQGVSSDSLAEDLGNSNWGRIQTWGFYDEVRTQPGTNVTAGLAVVTSSTAGAITDNKANGATLLSADLASVGVALETESSTNAAGAVDIMVRVD